MKDADPTKTPSEQDLTQKVINYIPVEIVTAWTIIYGVLNNVNSTAIYWIAFVILLIIVPIYVYRFTAEPDLPAARWQIIGSTGAYIVWVFAMGGPFTTIPGFTYNSQYGTIVLAIYAVVLVVMLGKNPPPPAAAAQKTEAEKAAAAKDDHV